MGGFEIFLVAFFLGLIPAIIAKNKGENFILWWIFGTLLFIIALPAALLIKPDDAGIEQEKLQSGEMKKCPYCAELIKSEAKVCRYCGKELPTLKSITLELETIVSEKKQNPSGMTDYEITKWREGFQWLAWSDLIGRNTQTALEIFKINSKELSDNSLFITYPDSEFCRITEVWINQIDLSSPFTAFIANSTSLIFVKPKDNLVVSIKYNEIKIIEQIKTSGNITFTISTFSGDKAKIKIEFGNRENEIFIDLFFERLNCIN
jgi:hypothetical protein